MLTTEKNENKLGVCLAKKTVLGSSPEIYVFAQTLSGVFIEHRTKRKFF